MTASDRLFSSVGTDHKKDVSIIIPMYNEGENILELMREIHEAMNGRYKFETICIDDGSQDDTQQKLREAKSKYPWLRVLVFQKRAWKGAGLRAGIRAAQSPLIVTIDGDRQNNPADIPRLLKFWEENAEPQNLGLIAGIRTKRRDTFLKRLSSRLANGIRSRLLKDNMRDTACGFKVFPRDLFLNLPYFDHVFRFLPALVQRESYKVATLPVEDRPRTAGKAKYGFWNRFWVGVVDLLGVMWLIRRNRTPGQITELH